MVRSFCAVAIAVLIAGVAVTGSSPATATHDQPYLAETPKKPVPASRQAPVKRQNFRARRADEIPPWEGFEDCPLGMPCVGIMEIEPFPHQD